MGEIKIDQLKLIEIIVTLVVALISFYLGISRKKPKLIGTGSGSGSIRIPGKDVMASSITIRNDPTFWGMRISRDLAKIDSARLYDYELKEYVGPSLNWKVDGSNDLAGQVTIESGKQASLYVFAKERHNQDFFVFSLPSLDAELPKYLTTYDNLKRDFSIHLFDRIGRKYKFNITVRNSDISVSIGFKLTFHSRFQMISQAYRLLLRAFSLNS